MSKLSEADIERWITVNGNHIPIKKGETEEEAVKRFTDYVDNATGKKKKKTEFDESKYKNINPGFDNDSNKKYDPYKWNCVRCAIAFEANMRGDDVEANPHDFANPDSNAKTHEYAITDAFGKKHDEWDVGANKRELVVKRITDLMEDFGPDSRAILFLAHKDGRHVVNVLANNGNPIIVDAQQGKHGSVKDMLKNYVTKNAGIIRVDDSDMNDEWKKWAYKKKGGK